jgi:uncharacterized protein (DUF2062 family)
MLIRPCILIPDDGHSGPIQKILEDCLLQTSFPVILVGQEGRGSLQNLQESKIINGALKEKRLSIVLLARNRGRGFSIQTGIQHAVKMAYTHLVTFEAGGCFKKEVVESLVKQVLETPWNLIIGVRKPSGDAVYEHSKWLRKLTHFGGRSKAQVKISDAQSQTRVYPLFFVQGMKFWTQGTPFETEVLIRLLWKKVEVTEVPVSMPPPIQGAKITRFQNFRDGLSISLLNLWLVFLSLMKEHRSPKETSLALGLGVFVGCTPFFGFHTALVLLLSPLLRLNPLFLWIGTQISIPPLAPLLAFASVNIGLYLMGENLISSSSPWTLKSGMEFLSYWILGSIILGTILSIVTMGLTYFVSFRFLGRRSPTGAWHGKIRGGRTGHRFIKWLLRTAGLKTAIRCLYLIVPYFYLFAPKARQASLEYWRTVNPDLNSFQIRGMVLKHFYRYGVLLLEQAYKNSGVNEGLRIESEGYENIQTFSNGALGGILLGAHVGAWNLALSLLADLDGINSFIFLQFESKALTFNKTHINQSGNPSFFYINERENPILDIYSLLKNKSVGHHEIAPSGKITNWCLFSENLRFLTKRRF